MRKSQLFGVAISVVGVCLKMLKKMIRPCWKFAARLYKQKYENRKQKIERQRKRLALLEKSRHDIRRNWRAQNNYIEMLEGRVRQLQSRSVTAEQMAYQKNIINEPNLG